MALPADSTQVMDALRLGWSVAELKGRCRSRDPLPIGTPLPSRNDHALPLRIERTPAELLLEVKETVVSLAKTFDVGQSAGATAGSCGLINEDVRLLAANASAPNVAEHIYQLDAETQDHLAADSQTQSCAYQLGRGLAECFWQLDPQSVGTANSWEFLLGSARCDELSRLAARLSSYFDPVAVPSVVGTLEIWRAVSADNEWRTQNEAHAGLFEQIRNWYALLIVGQSPSTFVTSSAKQPIRSQLKTALTAARALWVQIFVLAAGLGLIVLAITLTANHSSNPTVKAVLWVLGVIGISASTLQTRLKSEAQNLFERLAAAVNVDLVIVAITTAPPRPGKGQLRPGTMTSLAAARRVGSQTGDGPGGAAAA